MLRQFLQTNWKAYKKLEKKDMMGWIKILIGLKSIGIIILLEINTYKR